MEEFLNMFGEGQPTVPTLNSQDDHDKLDSGAKYYDPDGNLRTKK